MSEVDLVSPIPTIPEFYSGRSVFVTGFTGFLGQCLIEKLLWSCPDVKRVYVLVRPKKHSSIQDRVNKVLDSDCYERLTKRDPSFRNKIVPCSGDVQLPYLGLSLEDRERIVSQVSIIIHSAATVTFDAPLASAIDINIKGTRAILELALTMSHLVVFCHISTAFTNCNRDYVEEKMYPPVGDWKESILIRDKIDPSILNTLTYKYKGRIPNTYTFTKNLSEHMVYEYRDRLPIIIIRPSVVSGALREPFPGWFLNTFGPTGISLAYATGFLRVLLGNQDLKLDFLPCDLFCKGTIYVTALRPYQRKEVVPIYHASSQNMTLSFKQVKDFGKEANNKYPMKYGLWKPNIEITENRLRFYMIFYFCQLVPALLIDLLLRLFGQKPFMMKLERKMNSYLSVYLYFTNNFFLFDNRTGCRMEEFMREEDKTQFHYVYSLEEVNYRKYCENTLQYIGKKYFKQKPEDHVRAVRTAKVLDILDIVVKGGFFIYLANYVYTRQLIPYILVSTYNFLFNFS